MKNKEAEAIVNAYGRFIEENSSRIEFGLPETELPFTKAVIKQALRKAHSLVSDHRMEETIESCYLDLASFNDSFTAPLEIDARQVASGNHAEIARRFEVMEPERTALMRELQTMMAMKLSDTEAQRELTRAEKVSNFIGLTGVTATPPGSEESELDRWGEPVQRPDNRLQERFGPDSSQPRYSPILHYGLPYIAKALGSLLGFIVLVLVGILLSR